MIFDQNSNISFLGCGMALWIGGQISKPDGLFYQTKEGFEAKGATVHMETRVESIDYYAHVVHAVAADGTAIDQPALTEALNAGRIAGAALDVFAKEPIPDGDPIWEAKNLLITPHISGQMSLGYTRDKNVALFCEDLENYAAGRPLARFVDRRVGY